jgi:polyribonucleotide nucleotidyltransferase
MLMTTESPICISGLTGQRLMGHGACGRVYEAVRDGGQVCAVKVLDVDSQGKVRLSRKALLTPPEGYVPPPPREPRQGGDRDRRPMGGGNRDRDRGPRGPRN